MGCPFCGANDGRLAPGWERCERHCVRWQVGGEEPNRAPDLDDATCYRVVASAANRLPSDLAAALHGVLDLLWREYVDAYVLSGLCDGHIFELVARVNARLVLAHQRA